MSEKKKLKLRNLKSLLESNVNLDQEEKGIVRYLGGKSQAINVSDIVEYLKDHGYGSLDKKQAIERLDHLMEVGYVRSKTIGKGKSREEKFYLSKGIGGGGRRKREVQGRGPLYDIHKSLERFVGAIFVLGGLGFLMYQTIGMTGAFFSSAERVFPGFIFGFTLYVFGSFLLIHSFKKKK